ncbi:MAG: hypothetical protein GC134_07280 [Proteobacteria bacterium]|nr:hypothetical protein [Pseudomonadota bacterium]
MALLISIIVFVYVAFNIVTEYILGDSGLTMAQYIAGVTEVASAIIGGFVFVAISTKFITFEKFKRTGFEATFRDETGTGFNFPVSLSKFLPDIIAAPTWRNISEVEAELMGFLNGYRDWPYDITGETNKSLYHNAMQQWQAIQKLPNTTPLHGIAALAQDLGKVYAYAEKRKQFPFSEFWKRDKVTYNRRCLEHGGLSAFILSTIPSFMRMDERTRRAVLIAVRYRDNPSQIPANCDPLAVDIYESLHKAHQMALEEEGSSQSDLNPSEVEIGALKEEITAYFQSILRSMELNPVGQSEKSDGIYVGNGICILRMNRFVRAFAAVLTPKTRTRFNLWSFDGRQHPSWKFFISALRDSGYLLERFEEVDAKDGLFSLRINDLVYQNCIMIQVDASLYTDLRASLDTLPKWNGIIEVEQSKEFLVSEVKRKATEVEAMLERLRQEV